MTLATDACAAVDVRGLAKEFLLPAERVHTLKERALHPLRRRRHDRLVALDDVSFTVAGGEAFGIVGRNGSGKSTLLKCMAGIYQHDAGEIWLRGRVAPFIELGVGFNPELTARDNVLINAVMLGLSPREARRRFDEIIAFAELEHFVELKLKNYSSGMHVRLAFAVMVQVDADVLLIDEVLAVGDAAFQQKCHETLADLRRAGKTILLVTHDMDAVQRFADRALLLEGSHVAALGEPAEVADRYMEVNFARSGGATTEAAVTPSGRLAVLDARLSGREGEKTSTLPHGSAAALHVVLEAREGLELPAPELAVRDGAGRSVWTMSVGEPETRIPLRRGERAEIRVEFECLLVPGHYEAEFALGEPGQPRVTVAFAVTGRPPPGTGVVTLPHRAEVVRTCEAVLP